MELGRGLFLSPSPTTLGNQQADCTLPFGGTGQYRLGSCRAQPSPGGWAGWGLLGMQGGLALLGLSHEWTPHTPSVVGQDPGPLGWLWLALLWHCEGAKIPGCTLDVTPPPGTHVRIGCALPLGTLCGPLMMSTSRVALSMQETCIGTTLMGLHSEPMCLHTHTQWHCRCKPPHVTFNVQ